MTHNNDQLYIEKVLKGDANSFAVLVDRYKDMVFSLALKVMKNREEAEEVSQDTFIKAYRSLKHFKGDAKFSTWLYKIAYHNCMDRVKKISRKYNTDTIDEVVENKISATDDVLQTIERKERAEIIKACLNELAEDERSILWFFYFEELSLKEITKVTAFSENNVKVKLHRARKKLLAVIQDRVEPEMINHYGRK
jgi:RNA polymerase sigma-70 factor (ECF subfamily)